MTLPELPILVVDDDEDTRELYVIAFEAAGFNVRTAASIAEARKVLDEIEPVALIADYSLPDGDGTALLGLCSKSRPLLCALVTGFREQDVATSGFDLVLTKPVKIHALVAAVRERVAVEP